MESIKSYKTYFPYNNIENVLSRIKSMKIVRLKSKLRNRTKQIFFKNNPSQWFNSQSKFKGKNSKYSFRYTISKISKSDLPTKINSHKYFSK